MEEKAQEKKIFPQKPRRITYAKLFWLFIAGSLLGLVLEGFWCLFRYGQWETHVNTMWLPLCCIYGLGAAGVYAGCVALRRRPGWLKFLVFCLVGASVEFLCAWVLDAGLNMRAWDYSGTFLSIKGYVNFSMTILWGVLGMAFSLALPWVEGIFERMRGRAWHILCVCLSLVLAADLSLTAACVIRWSSRHEGLPPANKIESLIDSKYDDAFMSQRFCEWSFIE